MDGAAAPRTRRRPAGASDPVAQRARAGASRAGVPHVVPGKIRRLARRAGDRTPPASPRHRSGSATSRSAAPSPTSISVSRTSTGAPAIRRSRRGTGRSPTARRRARPKRGTADMAGPLSHIRVLDLSRIMAGPWAEPGAGRSRRRRDQGRAPRRRRRHARLGPAVPQGQERRRHPRVRLLPRRSIAASARSRSTSTSRKASASCARWRNAPTSCWRISRSAR